MVNINVLFIIYSTTNYINELVALINLGRKEKFHYITLHWGQREFTKNNINWDIKDTYITFKRSILWILVYHWLFVSQVHIYTLTYAERTK